MPARGDCTCFAASMSQLDANFGTLAVSEIHYTAKSLELLRVGPFLPEARIIRRDTAISLYSCGFDNDQADTLDGKMAKVSNMEVCRAPTAGEDGSDSAE